MRALVHDADTPGGLRLAEVAEPVPRESQVLVEVHATSLNLGELAYLAERRWPGEIPGWDAAGVVVRAAADGSGPAPGTRVTTFGWQGGWAEYRAAETADLAVVPDAVDLRAASTLPVAAVTALQALRRLGPVLGRRVLITGASGGVGRFAVRLAAHAGAEVVAAVGDPSRGENLSRLGAAQIVTALEDIGDPVFGVLDNVGGAMLAGAFGLLEPGGTALSIGQASGQATTIDFENERLRGGGRRLEPFVVSTPFGADLTYLVGLLAKGSLDPQIGWHGPRHRAAEAAEALLSRRVLGKAVLDVPHTGSDRSPLPPTPTISG
ncbi:zinc-binding dehydrogenase [Actinoallomurus bryophytorum]|uniref:NADPH:quinone reductase-like Zn-dependent oxidoreductase n=1 Tax=Actinoallomurus bryophytorum TaxID=1490222 RepID=A0A543CKZ6_9ACTN|nr:zinc-binding dehydrogenase [Actinoallomurus bryophytorum]TQL97771.1 NADPH:quinone reductase-like Zn-dependent oxidoreductase [Actinoallomurus bryophytorum]